MERSRFRPRKNASASCLTALAALLGASLLFGAPDLGAENGVRIRATELSGGVPFTVYFAATVPGGMGPGTRVEWDFGDGRVSRDPRVYDTFVEPGLYTVQLTVRFGDGSEQTAAVQVLAHYGG